MVRLEDNETHEIIEVDADAIKVDYLEKWHGFALRIEPTASGSYRLCSAAHRDAIRQSADELFAVTASPA